METERGIPDRYRAQCEFCKRDLDITAEGTRQRTTGWVEIRSGGGGHGISLPERGNRYAHARLTSGTFTQQELFGT